MFIKILISTFVTTYVTAEIPSYIHVCGSRNPNIDKCIIDSVNNLRSKLCEGIPELNVVPIKSLQVPKLTISETNNAKLYLRDAQIELCNFIINNLRIDLNKNHLDLELLFKDIFLNATYDFDIRVLIPITSKGLIFIKTENVHANVSMDLKTVMKNGKIHVYISNMILNFIVNDFSFRFEKNNSDQVQEIIADFISSNKEEILVNLKPSFEEAISKIIISTGNNIVKHFTYEELFPDRT